MEQLDWKKEVKKLVDLVGNPEAKRKLVIEGVSPQLADKLVGNRYPSQPGHLVMGAVKRAIQVAKQSKSAGHAAS